MSKTRNASGNLVDITVDASTDNPKDKGYHHYFEQQGEKKNPVILTFEVDTDPSVDSIHFVLWNLNDPVNPYVARSGDYCVDNDGHVAITIVDRPDEHLGPGPYCATLTATSSTAASAASEGGREIVGNAIYYYDTWKDSRRYPWPALS